MAKIIKLDETYFIEIDPYNWILKKKVVISDQVKSGKPSVNAGKTRDAICGYYPSLASALGHYVDNLEKDGISKDSEPVQIAGLETILLRIEKACKYLKLIETEDSK